MNYRAVIGDSLNINSFSKTVYNNNGIKIESDFKNITTHKNTEGLIICIGVIVPKEKNQSLDKYLEKIDADSLLDIVEQLEGRFVLFFVSNQGLFACSDEFGKLEMYYQQNDKNIILASNLDLLPECPAKKGFDQNALAHMLTYYGYCPPKAHTLYNAVKRLDVGEAVNVHNSKITFAKKIFFAKKSETYSEIEHNNYTNLFLEHLKRTVSEEGAMVYLSSGWDSTAILAGLVHLFGKNKISALIGRMKYSDRSGCCNQIEINKARKIANYYNIKLDIVDFDLTFRDKEYFNSLRKKMRSHQLYAMTSYTHDKLANMACNLTQNNKTIFAGEISDGAHNLGFSQYATIFHPSYGFREYSDKMASYLFGPTFLSLLINGEFTKDPVYKLFKERISDATFDEIAKTDEGIKLQLLTSFFLRNARLPLWSLDNEEFLTLKGRECYTREMQEKYLLEIAKDLDINSIFSVYLHLYNRFHWQGGTVRSLQVMADYYSLNTDLPFWDSHLQSFLSKMPEDWGRGLELRPTKYPLKKMLKEKIDYPYSYQEGPHSYTYDVDHSFSHVQEIYCYSALVEDFQNSLKNKPYHQILSNEYFDLNYIDNMVDQYIKSPREMSIRNITKLVPLIMLCFGGWYGKK
jgi:hypothetical protein